MHFSISFLCSWDDSSFPETRENPAKVGQLTEKQGEVAKFLPVAFCLPIYFKAPTALSDEH
jgi:hypothetical protein